MRARAFRGTANGLRKSRHVAPLSVFVSVPHICTIRGCSRLCNLGVRSVCKLLLRSCVHRNPLDKHRLVVRYLIGHLENKCGVSCNILRKQTTYPVAEAKLFQLSCVHEHQMRTCSHVDHLRYDVTFANSAYPRTFVLC